jgi:hypothetical protein
MIDPALAENEELRIVARSLSVLLRSGATGLDTALATFGQPSVWTTVSWSSTDSSVLLPPNSAKTNRKNCTNQIVHRHPLRNRKGSLNRLQ